MSPACVTGSLRSPRWASVSLLPVEPIHTFIFSSIECQTRNKHQGDSEAIPGLGKRPAWPPDSCVAGKLEGSCSGCGAWPPSASAWADAQKRATKSRNEGKEAPTLAVRGARGLGIFSLTAIRKKFHKCLWHISVLSTWGALSG